MAVSLVAACPRPKVKPPAGATEIVGSASTVRAKVFVMVLPFESVTATCTVYGVPELEAGVQLNEAVDPLQPEGRPDHEYAV